VRAAWRAPLAAAGQRPGQRAHLLRHQAEVLPRFAAAYVQLQALPRAQRRRLFRRLKQSLASLALLLALGQAPALAATIQVNGTCTLVDAITAANTDTATGDCPAGDPGADTIVLPANSTISLTDGQLPITSAIIIEGNGATIARDSSAPPFRIFDVGSGANLTLNHSIISGGSAEFGGGILNYGGSLTLTNSTVSGNTVARGGGGIENFYGSLTLTNSTVSGNTGSGNTVARGGGIRSRGGQATLINSTVSGNSASHEGGGIYATAGALTLTNSTVSGNSSTSGGGIITIYGTLTLAHSLVSGNTASQGPEIHNHRSSSTVTGNNFNLIGHDGNAGSINFSPSGTDIVPSQPLAAILDTTLANNGGPTKTHALVPGSPALNAIPATAPGCTGTDQRGVSRPQGAGCDSGAFELEEDPVSTVDLLAFFDQAVAAGTLTGVGSGKVAALRLKAVRAALVLAHELVERDRVRLACSELLLVLRLTDGQPQPRDLVTGEAAPELARQIMHVRTALGCE
jgi:predicted outer membrane repeat protein